MEHFRTSRLIARDWTDGDAQAAFDIYGRDEVMRWLGAQPRRPVQSLTHMRDRLDLMIQRASRTPAGTVRASPHGRRQPALSDRATRSRMPPDSSRAK